MVAAVAIATGGCGDSAGVPTPSKIVVQNRTALEIDFVFIVGCPSGQGGIWGSDRLLASEVIAPGSDRTFQVAGGCWDIRVQNADGAIDRLGVQIAENQTYEFTVTP